MNLISSPPFSMSIILSDIIHLIMNFFNCDFLIVGGGISGLTAARQASKYGSVILITKGKTEETATEKAQGGIAVALDKKSDSTTFHLEDTLIAGAGLCDKPAVDVLVKDGIDRVKELIEMGANFDKTATGFELNIEGAHRQRRILHAGDYTGKEIAQTLAAKVIKDKLVEIKNYIFCMDLIIDNNLCKGIVAYDVKNKTEIIIKAKATIISSGGAGQIYQYTTNPQFATGDGIAAAYRAGAIVSDMEFVQFHPTALVSFKALGEEIAFPQFLISEAVRGEGAILLNHKGERFISELAPRDVVARAIFEEMKKSDSNHVHLNLSKIDPDKVKKRFPTIYKTCQEIGLDLSHDDIPVAPAAHFLMGGIKTDLFGATNIKGLWAAGEAMSSGVHGANRLASNSLLEGVVFGHRAAIAANEFIQDIKYVDIDESKVSLDKPAISINETKKLKNAIKKLMWDHVGIVRNKTSLETACGMLNDIQDTILSNNTPVIKRSIADEIELRNMLLVSKLICHAAHDRTESRGAHFRSDYPAKDDAKWLKHLEYSQ